jgi:hypothetical protein
VEYCFGCEECPVVFRDGRVWIWVLEGGEGEYEVYLVRGIVSLYDNII